jgi:hypothetical protein
MNAPKWHRISFSLICLTLMLALSIGNAKASPTQQAETDFAAIDAYVTEQMKHLGILSPQGMAELHAPAIPVGGDVHYAMGWEVGTSDGIPVLGHGGALRNFRSQMFLLPESGWGVILLVNAHGFEQLMQVPEVAKGIMSPLNGKPPAPVSLPIKVRFLYWAILLTPLLMILGMAYSWRYWRNKGAGHILLVVLSYGGLTL